MLLNSKLFLDRELAISIILSSFIIGIGLVLKWGGKYEFKLTKQIEIIIINC
jgi:hypothetical protein